MNVLKPVASQNPEPLGEEEFDALMAACGPWEEVPRFAVAVSGGPDSTALALLLHHWAQKRGGKILALTVDHRLRQGSGDEARLTRERLNSLGIASVLLQWAHQAPPRSAIHAAARKARYDLLLDACRAHHIAHLFLAHHADDQAETVLMRLSRSTGIDGLAGMAVKREQDGIQIIRPLLPVKKVRLEATCQAHKHEFAIDPSNDWERYTRARLRGMHAALSRAGLTTDRLVEIAREAGAVRAHLEKSCNAWVRAHAVLNSYGVASLSLPAWMELDQPLRLRVLSRVLVAVGGGEYPPRGASLERLAAQIATVQPQRYTLAGCCIQVMHEALLFTREEGTVTEETPLASFTPYRRWDNRFLLFTQPGFDTDGLVVRRLGHVSRHALMKKGAESVAQLPAATRAALPGIFHDSSLFMVPQLSAQKPGLERQAPVTAVFSPRQGFFIKPFSPASYIMSA